MKSILELVYDEHFINTYDVSKATIRQQNLFKNKAQTLWNDHIGQGVTTNCLVTLLKQRLRQEMHKFNIEEIQEREICDIHLQGRK